MDNIYCTDPYLYVLYADYIVSDFHNFFWAIFFFSENKEDKEQMTEP